MKRKEVILSNGLLRLFRILVLSTKKVVFGTGRKKILVNYPDGKRSVCISYNALNLRGIQSALFFSSLKLLEKYSFLKLKIISKRRTEIFLNEKSMRLIEIFKSNLSMGKAVNREITLNDILLLEITNRLGHMPNIKFLSRKLGISTPGIIRLINKNTALGFIRENGLLTETGHKFLELFRDLIYDQEVPFILEILGPWSLYSPHITNRRTLRRTVRVIASLIDKLITYSVRQKGVLGRPSIGILSFSSDNKIFMTTKLLELYLRKKYEFSYLNLSFAPPTLFVDKEVGDKLLSLLDTILDTHDFDFLILIAYPMLVDKIIKRESNNGPKIIAITRVSRHIAHFSNDIGEIHNRYVFLKKTIIKALSAGKHINISWPSIDSTNHIEIRPTRHIPEKILHKAVTGILGYTDSHISHIPYGALRLSLSALKDHIEVHGAITICDEPIFGLKAPSNGWIRDLGGRHCHFSLIKSGDIKFKLRKEFRYSPAKRLNGSSLVSIHIGLNELKSSEALEKISLYDPPLLRFMRDMITLRIDKKNIFSALYVTRDSTLSINGNRIIGSGSP